MSNKLIETLPIVFETAFQKAAMCEFLWTTNEDAQTIIDNLRMYDMVRRFYYVRTGEQPTSDRVIELMKFIKGNSEINKFFMYYCRQGVFPDNNTIQLIKY